MPSLATSRSFWNTIENEGDKGLEGWLNSGVAFLFGLGPGHVASRLGKMPPLLIMICAFCMSVSRIFCFLEIFFFFFLPSFPLSYLFSKSCGVANRSTAGCIFNPCDTEIPCG